MLRPEAQVGLDGSPADPETVRRVLSIAALCGAATLKYAAVPDADRPFAAMVLGIAAGMIVLLDAQPVDLQKPATLEPAQPLPPVTEALPEDRYPFEDWEDATRPSVTAHFTGLVIGDWHHKIAKSILVVQRYTGDLLTPEIVNTMMRAEEGYDGGW